MTEYDFIDFEVPAKNVYYFGEPETAPYVSIKVGELSFVKSRPTIKATDHDTFTFRLPKKNARGEDYKVELRGQVVVPGKTETEASDFTVTTSELKEMFDRCITLTNQEEPKFVAIKISKKRFCGEPWQTENMKEANQTIFAPDGYTYYRTLSQLHDIKDDSEHVMIYLPEKRQDGSDYMVSLTKRIKQEDGSYQKESLEVSSLDLSRMYQVERKQYLNQRAKESDYVEIIISKKQVVGEPWVGQDGAERRNILAPDGYTFSRKSDQLHEIKNDLDHYKINLPKTYASGDPYVLILAKAVKKEDNTYDKETKELTSEELKAAYDIAKVEFKRARAR